MIANAKMFRLHRTGRDSKTPKTVKAFSPNVDIVWATSASKITSYMLTYPLESLKLISMSEEKRNLKVHDLYKGFVSYIPFCVFTNVVTFNTFFFVKSHLATLVNHDLALYVMASIMTSVITSIYKIPYTYYLKSSVLKAPISFHQLYEPSRYKRTMKATLAEDIPDLCIKAFCAGGIVSNSERLFIAALSSFLTSPIEVWKSSVLCHPLKIVMKPVTLIIIVFVSLTRTLMYLRILDFIHSML